MSPVSILSTPIGVRDGQLSGCYDCKPLSFLTMFGIGTPAPIAPVGGDGDTPAIKAVCKYGYELIVPIVMD